jgi:hypothetical protein
VAKGTRNAVLLAQRIRRGRARTRSASLGRHVVIHAAGKAFSKIQEAYARRYASVTGPGGGREQPRPRGPLFSGDDPTLAKRFEEELHGFGR